MRHRIAVGGVMAALALASAVVAADALKSGPQPGDTVRAPFNVNKVFDSNESRPKSLCYVWANGANPVAMIFARDPSDTLTSLVKKIDAATEKNSNCKMGSFVVFLNDDEDIEKRLKDLADKEHLSKIALTTLSSKAGPEAYKIAKDAEVTVVLYSKNKCQANYAFKKGEMTDADVEKIVADVAKIIPEKDSDK